MSEHLSGLLAVYGKMVMLAYGGSIKGNGVSDEIMRIPLPTGAA